MIARIKELFSSEQFAKLRTEALHINEFFTPEFIDYAVGALCDEFLDDTKVNSFIAKHGIERQDSGRTVGVLCAGNLPLVGFGDMFYSLLCGYNVALKTSRRDPLMQIFTELPEVTIVDNINKFQECDAILAMGSDEVCKILDDKFPTTPSLLRGAMHSVAILSGEERPQELEKLALDIFLYCTMGCRSTGYLYIPHGYDFTSLTQALSKTPLPMPRAWDDNYRYQKARATMNMEEFVDGGFYILKETGAEAVLPLGVIGYSTYSTPPTLADNPTIQHIATAQNFGTAQHPTLEDFSGGLSVVEFLKRL